MKLKKLSTEQRSKMNRIALYALLIFIGFVVADLLIIAYRDMFLPDQAPPKKAARGTDFRANDRSQYSIITSRNLFNSKGEIPDPLRPQTQAADAGKPKDDTPVQSSLPITLLGTLVHSNPAKSVAAVEIKSKNMSGSYTVGAEMEGLARLEKVERGIIYFRNLNNHMLEYIEMNKGNNKVSFDGNAKPTTAPTPLAPAGKEVVSTAPNTYEVKRADLNKYLNDMSSLLMQARAIPNRDPNTGEINGFRLVDFQPDSIFGQLDIPRGAVIKGANGNPITSIQDAMTNFNNFKTSNLIKLNLEINGSDVMKTYNVK